MKTIIVVGGGAGGFFGAINCKLKHPAYQVLILEKGKEVLQKVRISGGGRCNVTHACFDPEALSRHYPRGQRIVRKAFHRFQPKDTIKWFAERGVKLKTEADGRMFPVTNKSQTIIDCFLHETQRLGIKLRTQTSVIGLRQTGESWEVLLKGGETLAADAVLLATGSNPTVWKWLKKLGHEIESPVPSLFTFKIDDPRLEGLAGISMPEVKAQIVDTKLRESGALLITHWGLSAPAILRLSAWGAQQLHAQKYRFTVRVNFLPEHTQESVRALLRQTKEDDHKKQVQSRSLFGLPSRFWKKLVAFVGIGERQRWAEISKKHLNDLTLVLTQSDFQVTGKSTFKDEFVTCGGVQTSEVNFQTMESKRHPGLFFTGEVLNVDAITGGFNFQHAWTSAWIAAEAM